MKIKCNIFSVRSGFSGLDSPTHHAIFDLTILPSIPNVNVRFPSTLKRAKIITKKLLFKEKTCDIVLLPYFPVVDSVKNLLIRITFLIIMVHLIKIIILMFY